MTFIRFKLKISTLQKNALTSAGPLDVDGVTQDGRLYRAAIDLIEPAHMDDKDLADIHGIIKELIPILIRAGYHAPDVEEMTFSAKSK